MSAYKWPKYYDMKPYDDVIKTRAALNGGPIYWITFEVKN